MRITRRQIRGIIKEAMACNINEATSGYMVPNFETTEDMMLFIDELGPNDPVTADVYDPISGEIWIEAGMTPLEAGLVEVEPEEQVEESDPDELDNYDWDAWEAEQAQKEQAAREEYDRVLEKAKQIAFDGGADFAADTLSDAKNMADRGAPELEGLDPKEWAWDKVTGASWDAATGIISGGYDDEVDDLYRSLSRERDNYSYKPTKDIFVDILADEFASGGQKQLGL